MSFNRSPNNNNNGLSRGGRNSNNPSGNNRHNKRDHAKTIRVSGLHSLTIPSTLMAYFDRFQVVKDATLDQDENDNRTGTATIVFQKPHPNPAELVQGIHKIDGKLVGIEFIRNQPVEHNFTWETTMLFPCSFSMGFMRSPKCFTEGWSSQVAAELKFEFNYTMRRINIYFSHLKEEYKVEYKFKDVEGEMHGERTEDETIFTIPLRYPGVYWKRNQQVITETRNYSKRGKQWERVTLIPLTEDSDITTRQKTPFLPMSHPNALDLGNWLTYRLVFRPGPKFVDQFNQKLKNAADFNLVPRGSGWKEPFITVEKIGSLPKPLGHTYRRDLNLHFNVLYMIESCISYRFLNEYNLNAEFYRILKELDHSVACGMLQIFSEARQRVWNPEGELYQIYKRLGMKVQQQRNIPSNCALLRKIIVTPSHIYIQPPSVETTNRVVRHYKDQSEGFIRVQFMDEGFNRVGAGHSSMTKESIYNRIFTILKRGVQIGDKKYEFLAFSSSQLREQGCWFYAPTMKTDAAAIRTWMGVFSHEKVVAKHAIRMGQCFSSTRPVYVLEQQELEYIDDVKHAGYTFSDGVGKISPYLAKEVAYRLELKSEPSAFQFRLGGAKGVLTIDQGLVNTPIKVQLRPSQIKFDSKHLTLEVIRTSTYIHGYLNRQVITLLSALGITDQVFLDFMNEMLQDVDKLFSKPEEAIRILQGNIDEAGTALFMVSLIQSGFLERGDPYIKNLLNLFRVNILKDLKKKAKIIVPNGAYLLGVMDETGTLEEGEVFVQIHNISATSAMKKEIITGDVVVFRNPCFHPGDVRIVKAVDRPELHYLVDVVVFSSKGTRDIPSMCSGGDLDGDDYTVYWDKRLIPSANYSPMDYTPAPTKCVEQVEIKDILKFFVNYINNDNLGQIANAHLATADQSSVGARDGKCIRLAQLHSEAVDFPKSGKPALLTQDLKVRMFPDFMQKKDRESYQSKKILGKIFRSIDKSNYKNYKSALTSECTYDIRLRVPKMELYIAEARDLRTTYNNNLSAHMNQFGVQTEAEICSGYVIKWLKKGKSKTKYKQSEYTSKAMKAFKSLWKRTFEAEFLDETKQIDLAKTALMEAKAAAWYYVTYHPNERQRDMSVEGGFFSFPWVVSKIICDIARRNKSKPDEIDIEASMPIPEEVITEGSAELAKMNNELRPIIENDDTDEEDEEDQASAYETDDTDDNEEDEVIIHNLETRRVVVHPHPRNNNAARNQADASVITRPLEALELIVGEDASDDELLRALSIS